MRALLALTMAACVQAPRTDTVATAKAVDSIEVRAEPDGIVGWTFAVKNETGEQIGVVWDESTFVDAGGVSRGDAGDLGICERVERAFCFDTALERGKIESCHPTPKSCDSARAAAAATAKNVGACRIRG